MNIYKRFFNETFLEMSTKRQIALHFLMEIYPTLLAHLIIDSELPPSSVEHKKHVKEIKDYVEQLDKANKKRNTNKTWFDWDEIEYMSTDFVSRALKIVYKKYPKLKLKKEYTSLADFDLNNYR